MSWWMVAAVLSTSAAHAEDANVDVTPALQTPKKAKWEAKGKALDPFGRGDTKRKNEDWAAALPLLVEAASKQPGCGKCLDSLSRALIGAERYEDAVKVADLLVQLYPDRDEGHLRISDAWTKAEDWEKAVQATTAILERDKANVGLWWRRNSALRELGWFDQAREFLDGAEAAGVAKPEIACLRITLRAAEGDAVGARGLWEECGTAGNLELKRYAEGWLAMAEGDVELAAKRLVLSGADEQMSRVALAFLRLDQGKHEGALNLSEKMLAEGGAHAWDAWLAKAMALKALGRNDDAAAALKSGPMADGWAEAHPEATATDVVLVARGPDWPKEVGRRAAALHIELLALAGDAEGAKALYDQAVAVHGESDDLKAALETAPPEPTAEK